MKKLMEVSELQKKILAKHIIETEELAAEFAESMPKPSSNGLKTACR